MITSRRGFGRLAVSGLAASAGLLAARKKIPIAVQLYSVRQIAAKDLAGVLGEVSKLGYQGVEFAGYYDHSAQEIRKMLDANGLKVAGTHIGLETLQGDNLARTMEFNRTIGNKNLIVPGLARKYTSSIAAWKETARLFSDIAATAKPQGFTVGYHNHVAEFQKLDGETPFDAFFGTASKDVKVQLDIGHAKHGGGDPVAVLKKYRGRVVSVHVKDYSPGNPNAGLGEGIVDWKDVFKAVESGSGAEWYIVEEEARTCQGYGCIQRSIELLRKWGK